MHRTYDTQKTKTRLEKVFISKKSEQKKTVNPSGFHPELPSLFFKEKKNNF
jgi:hypothetical protein